MKFFHMGISPNNLFILGLVLPAIGVAAGAYLQRLSAQKSEEETSARTVQAAEASNKEILAKFDHLEALLAKAEKATPGPEQQQQIIKISEEFKTWATFFDANRPELSRSIDQARGELTAQRLSDIKIPLDFFSECIADLRQTVAAYNAIPGHPAIKANLPPLESDALTDTTVTNTPGWSGNIVFSTKTSWQLAAQRSSPGRYTLFISGRTFDGANDLHTGDLQIQMIGQPSTPSGPAAVYSWMTTSFGDYFELFPETKVRSTSTADRASLKRVVQQWFQTQILLTEKEPH